MVDIEKCNEIIRKLRSEYDFMVYDFENDNGSVGVGLSVTAFLEGNLELQLVQLTKEIKNGECKYRWFLEFEDREYRVDTDMLDSYSEYCIETETYQELSYNSACYGYKLLYNYKNLSIGKNKTLNFKGYNEYSEEYFNSEEEAREYLEEILEDTDTITGWEDDKIMLECAFNSDEAILKHNLPCQIECMECTSGNLDLKNLNIFYNWIKDTGKEYFDIDTINTQEAKYILEELFITSESDFNVL